MVKHTSGTGDQKRRNEFNLAHVVVFMDYIFKEGQIFFFFLVSWDRKDFERQS